MKQYNNFTKAIATARALSQLPESITLQRGSGHKIVMRLIVRKEEFMWVAGYYSRYVKKVEYRSYSLVEALEGLIGAINPTTETVEV